MTYFNRRIFLLVFGWMVILVFFLTVTHFPIFPCQEFITDSRQGYYLALCPLVNDRGLTIFSAPGYYDPIRSVWTWVGIGVVFFGIPYAAAILLNRSFEKRAK